MIKETKSCMQKLQNLKKNYYRKTLIAEKCVKTGWYQKWKIIQIRM